MSFPRNKWARGGAALLAAAGLLYAYSQYRAFMAPPASRLAAGAYYPEMPPDALHHYLRLPLDHFAPGGGTYTGFYILSPGFKPGAPTALVITDGQQELVSVTPDMAWFAGRLGAQQYALLAGRGNTPTLFPELYGPGGAVDYRAAMNLYGAALAQRYMGKYGANVQRALLESTGGLDLARANGIRFSKNLYELDPGQAELFAGVKSGRTALAFMLFKLAQENRDSAPVRQAILKAKTGFYPPGTWEYFKRLLSPVYNWRLIKLIISAPAELAVRVRMYELLSADLKTYRGENAADVNLMCEWAGALLTDFQAAESSGRINVTAPAIDRAAFKGEVLVFSGTKDHVFTQRMGRLVAGSYGRSAFASFEDIHRLGRYPEYYRTFRQAFFSGGLSSPELKKCFADERQLNR